VIKLRRMKWVGYVRDMKNKRDIQNLLGNFEGRQ
jgi:hypothetical protein